MKKLLILPVFALASCAPTVTQSPTYIDSRTYTTTCAAALDEVARVAPTLRPASLGGLGTWPPYTVANRNANTLTLISTSTAYSGAFGGLTPITNSTSSVWSCAEAAGLAALTVSSTGQREDFMRAIHNAFFGAITLPK
ncbi:hypothetical protein ACFFLM_19310 [Deinococcus oregonensis]|uniref:Lipoprotein n=1 Tax=Deinococcus oregonensis TaxID=1805970 RepID=A0ABV6B2W6_9DEIO